MRMSIFIKENRKEITEYIQSICPNQERLNDKDREDWIMYDETLYNWARREGVKI